MHESQHDQLGQRVFDLGAQHGGRFDDLVEKTSAVILQMLHYPLGARAHR